METLVPQMVRIISKFFFDLNKNKIQASLVPEFSVLDPVNPTFVQFYHCHANGRFQNVQTDYYSDELTSFNFLNHKQ